MMCPQQQHLHLLIKGSRISLVADNAKTHAEPGSEKPGPEKLRRRSEPLRGYISPRSRQRVLKRAQSDRSVSRWDSEASSCAIRDVLPSGAKHLSPMQCSTVHDTMLTMPRRRRSIEDPTLLAHFAQSLSCFDDEVDTQDPQSATAFLAAALETLEFYESEMSSLLMKTAS